MRVLFLTHRLPYAPNRGDRVRAYFLLRTLREHADVDLVSLVHDDDEATSVDALRDLTSSVSIARVSRRANTVRSLLWLPTTRPTTHTMLDAADLTRIVGAVAHRHRPDVVLAYCSGMARLAFAPDIYDLPLVLDMVDVDSAKWQALSAVTPAPLAWVYRREAIVLRRFERQAALHARVNMVVTESERSTLAELAPDARIEVVPNGVDVERLRPPGASPPSSDVVFCGVMDYAPNEEAAVFLVSNIWPTVRSRRPDAVLKIVGANPTTTVRRLADASRGIHVTGTVDDVRPHLWNAAVSTAPLLTARGIQNKVLEAVSAGLPTVVTTNVMASLPGSVQSACRSGETAGQLADAIVHLLNLSPSDRRVIAGGADIESLTWERQLSRVPALLGEAARSAGRRSRSRAS